MSIFKREKAFLYTDFTDPTVYAIDRDLNHYPVYEFTWDAQPPVYYREKVSFEESQANKKYVFFAELKGNENYLFMRFRKEGIRYNYYVLLDERNEKTYIWKRGYSSSFRYSTLDGIPNDLDGGQPFWPLTTSRDGEFLASFHPDSLRFHLQQTPSAVKDTLANEQLRKLVENTPSENPVIGIIKTK
jgi:hypothetical protein